NGGDALVAARFVEDYDPRVLLLGRADNIRTEITSENWEALAESGFDVGEVRDSEELADEFESVDTVVDGMLGTGVSGELREPVSTAVELTNSCPSETTVLSVDVPTGVDPDEGVRGTDYVEADAVVTFHDTKPGVEDVEADVEVVDIGIPDAAHEFVGAGDLHRLERRLGSHKGENGEVLVVGGGPYTGAPALSSLSSLRSGTDLVRVATPGDVSDEIQGYTPNLISHSLDDEERVTSRSLETLVELAEGNDVVLVGPGLGDADDTLEAAERFVERILEMGDGPAMVLDAEAIEVVENAETEPE
ncbi:MAG: NAD(P)H-hydrate epimerase, partial [Halobacteria archaeon]|nr:NAD(P)H-hydrate epimerase [Halobacteria archaeon]